MMAQDWEESTREPINYGSFINQLPPEINAATWKDIYKNV